MVLLYLQQVCPLFPQNVELGLILLMEKGIRNLQEPQVTALLHQVTRARKSQSQMAMVKIENEVEAAKLKQIQKTTKIPFSNDKGQRVLLKV